MKKNKNKGFTLMEMLIVVGIIAVLIAIAIPVFSTQMEKSREAVDLAIIRSAYAEVLANYLTGEGNLSKTVKLVQTENGWKTGNAICGNIDMNSMNPVSGGSATVSCDATGTVTIAFSTTG